MRDADDLYAELTRIMGGDPVEGVHMNLSWDSPAAGRAEVKRLKLMKKELAMVKRDAAASIREVKSHFVSQRSNVEAGFVASLFGKKSAARDRIEKREEAKRAEAAASRPYERVRDIVDQLSVQLDRAVLEVERNLAR